ncbi:hypothetical protein KI688_011655 [Linnemannia hyalina]|uniref:Uncharacterized protein n=1 Tax=Linnemannia hyalina TaxID=64524 RepID=A0A9P8BUA9_9FUNG|nr:hypothetical protein KI688_011655 [Linnemannia hyalina]
MEADLRIRKQHFVTIRKNLDSAFYWSLSSRRHFAENDYQRNIYSLGPASNYSIIKAIGQDQFNLYLFSFEIPFTPTNLVRSVSGQLALEFKKIYRNGTFDLYKKKMGTQGTTVDIQIREEISAAGNFHHLNKLTKNSRKIAPFTTSQQPIVAFSERELALLFWKRKPLRERLEEFARQDHTQITSTNDLETWITGKEPGTDGFRVQLLAFKLRELQDVRYQRLSENRLPPRLTPTVGGTDYYLQEIQNVITSKEDIERL